MQRMQLDIRGLGRRIRNARRRAGLSQRALSQQIGRSDCYIQHIENGLCLPSSRALIDICYALNVPPNEIYGDSLPENLFNSLPLFYGVRFKNDTIFRNSLTNWLNVNGPDESLIEPDPPVDLKKLPPLRFHVLSDELPPARFYPADSEDEEDEDKNVRENEDEND